MKTSYRVIDKTDSRALSDYLSRQSVLAPPLRERIQEAKLAVDEIIVLGGRAVIEGLLPMGPSGRRKASLSASPPA